MAVGLEVPRAIVPGKGERTRRRLLESAVRRFGTDGFRQTSVSEIARDAGVTPAAAYAYFEGKLALFEAAVDTDASGLIDDARARVPAEVSVRDRFGFLLSALVERLGDYPLARRVLGGSEPEVVGRLLDLPSLRALVTDLTASLAAGQKAGEVRRDVDPAVLAEGLEAIVLALLMAQLQAGVDPGSHRAQSVFTVLDTALKPPV
jgi:AcrR family transcriptional regulator